MAEKDRWQRGLEMMQKVYAGDVVTPPRGAMAFSDLMLEQLFAEVWSREDVLSIRDRRLLLLGAICALGEPTTFQIQAKAALKNGELTAEQVREVLIHLAQYAGYPRVAALIGPVEQVIAQAEKSERAGGD
jgi:4-carboxymuconolactone decarboxylase